MQFHTTGIVLAALTVVSAASAQTTQAVEWKVSEGGNGHWYQWSGWGAYGKWSDAVNAGTAKRAHLVTLQSVAEESFVRSLVGSDSALREVVIGAFQPDGSAEPSGGWRWVTDEPLSYTNWRTGSLPEPNNGNTAGPANVEWFALLNMAGAWNDGCDPLGSGNGVIFEWDTDCNGDGIVDYGQILRGELADLNGNGVPDVCEISVSGVTPPSVPSQGGSTITIRGTNFQGTPSVKIGGIPATNVVTVSPISLTATSPALAPGMTSVTVNGFTLPDAIYIRPECGSDLDQNGTVDTGDISIILLDFGPCYQAPLAAPAPEVPPLLDAQPLPDAPRQR